MYLDTDFVLLLWNLIYLAMASTVVYALFIMFGLVKIRKPYVEFVKKTRRHPIRK